MKPTMHPTETEKAQPWIARVVHHGDYNPNGDSYGYIQTENAAIDVIVPPNMKDEFPALLERIIACHNACAGIPDPASAVPALVAALEKLWGFVEDLRTSNPGYLGKLVLQDYAQLNEALIETPRALALAGKLAKGGKR